MKKILLILLIIPSIIHAQLIDAGTKISTQNIECWTDLSYLRSFDTVNNRTVSLINIGYVGNLLNGANLVNRYINLDGVNDVVRYGTANFNYTSESFSIELWIYFSKFRSSDPLQGVVPFWKGNFRVNGYYCQLDSLQAVFVTSQSGANQVTTANLSSNPLVQNTWYNLVITRNGASAKIYIDGVNVVTTSGTHVNPTSAPLNNFTLGSYGPQFYMLGRIGVFNVYTKELTQTEVTRNFNALKNRYK